MPAVNHQRFTEQLLYAHAFRDARGSSSYLSPDTADILVVGGGRPCWAGEVGSVS